MSVANVSILFLCGIVFGANRGSLARDDGEQGLLMNGTNRTAEARPEVNLQGDSISIKNKQFFLPLFLRPTFILLSTRPYHNSPSSPSFLQLHPATPKLPPLIHSFLIFFTSFQSSHTHPSRNILVRYLPLRPVCFHPSRSKPNIPYMTQQQVS